MSYTNNLDNPELYFQTKLYTGTGSSNAITLDGSENMQPDFVWCKNRASTKYHGLYDSVRGTGTSKSLTSNSNEAEGANANYINLTSFDSDGFTLGATSNTNQINTSGENHVAWNWKAGGTAPAITYVVKVVSDSGNKYRFDDFGTSAVTLDLQEGGTYTFDQSDSSNATHPLRFYTAADKSGGEYTTGVTTSGTAGSSGAKTVITVAASAPTLYYQCSSHSAMGGQANTNSTFGSSNFGGSIQSTVSANTTAGFSIISYTGTGSVGTVAHGLGVIPKMIIFKNRTTASNWLVYADAIGNTKNLYLDATNAEHDRSDTFNDTSPTSSVFTVGTADLNTSGNSIIAYCFADVKGYSKVGGSYTGNGNADGTFVYTGFKPAWLMIKANRDEAWYLFDNKRLGYNVDNNYLLPNLTNAEGTTDYIDFTSNGFKIRYNGAGINHSGTSNYYMAFAESPLVNSNGVPNNAR